MGVASIRIGLTRNDEGQCTRVIRQEPSNQMPWLVHGVWLAFGSALQEMMKVNIAESSLKLTIQSNTLTSAWGVASLWIDLTRNDAG